jgi:hypothetical protein
MVLRGWVLLHERADRGVSESMRGLERNGNYLNLRLHLVVLRRLLILEPPVPRMLERISCMDHGLATLSCTRAREEGGKTEQLDWRISLCCNRRDET